MQRAIVVYLWYPHTDIYNEIMKKLLMQLAQLSWKILINWWHLFWGSKSASVRLSSSSLNWIKKNYFCEFGEFSDPKKCRKFAVSEQKVLFLIFWISSETKVQKRTKLKKYEIWVHETWRAPQEKCVCRSSSENVLLCAAHDNNFAFLFLVLTASTQTHHKGDNSILARSYFIAALQWSLIVFEKAYQVCC